jgi:hypothetical protein
MMMTMMIMMMMVMFITFMIIWVIITTITISPLVFVIVIFLKRIVLLLIVMRVYVMILHFFHLKKKKLYSLASNCYKAIQWCGLLNLSQCSTKCQTYTKHPKTLQKCICLPHHPFHKIYTPLYCSITP